MARLGSRLKALLLCGSPVIHVDAGAPREFFMPLLQMDRHLVVVSRVQDILAAVKRLRNNATLARRIGRAGRRVALNQLSMQRALAYLRALFSSYSSVQRERVEHERGYTRVDTVAQAASLTHSCECKRPGVFPLGYPAACSSTPDVETWRGAQGRTREQMRGAGRRLLAQGRRGGKAQMRAKDLMEDSSGSLHCCKDWDCPREVCPEALVTTAKKRFRQKLP